LWKDVRAVARRTKELRVLDVATGSGDVAIGLAKRARAAGVRLDVHATDISEVALACARERATHKRTCTSCRR
jgi:methylase of polypeptide subunit release factors